MKIVCNDCGCIFEIEQPKIKTLDELTKHENVGISYGTVAKCTECGHKNTISFKYGKEDDVYVGYDKRNL